MPLLNNIRNNRVLFEELTVLIGHLTAGNAVLLGEA